MNFLNRKVNAKKLLKEVEHVLTTSSQTRSTTTNGKVIYTDFGYISDFFNQLLNSIEE